MSKGGARPLIFSACLSSVRWPLAALLLGLASVLVALVPAHAYDKFFLVKPYLQLGYEPKKDRAGLDIVWLSEDAKHKWQVRYVTAKEKAEKSGDDKSDDAKSRDKGREAEWITERMISLPGHSAPYYKLTAHLNKLQPGEPFDYKVLRDGEQVFAATGRGRKVQGQPSNVVLFGDCGINSPGQRKLSKQLEAAKPDMVVILGDIVYQQGLFSQYLSNFFPVYNKDPEKPRNEKKAAAHPHDEVAIESMRSTLWVGVIGNHDISLSGLNGTNIDRFPDCLAYYLFWNEPLNGYKVPNEKLHQNFSFMSGDLSRQEMFRKSAGDSYPIMNNFSYDYGDAHFVALDGNYYMDWSDPKLRAWLENDLKAAQGKAWRILLMHQPGFLLGAPHWKEQKMRMICDIAEKYNVNMVLAGHAHCYERSRPLKFSPPDGEKSFTLAVNETVAGKITQDKKYDGVKNTTPDGIIYIVTGEGGATLYPIDPDEVNAKDSYMVKTNSSVHSFSQLAIDDKKLSFKQVDEDGRILDQFVISK